MNIVQIKMVLSEGAVLPVYSSEEAAGADICACLLNGPVVIHPRCRMAIPTGIRMQIPYGYEVQIRPRSGLALKKGITVLNSPGTIDSDFRGEILVILVNLSDEDFIVNHKDRIAQMVASPVIRAVFKEESELSETGRGENGFGSSGIRYEEKKPFQL